MQLTTGFRFIRPYDHLDLYRSEFHNRKYYIKFSVKDIGVVRLDNKDIFNYKKNFKKTESVFRTYIHKNYDSSLWMTLTRDNVNNPFRFFKLLGKDSHTLKIFAKAWIYTSLRVIFGKKYSLFTPIPSMAQHLDNQCMAPGMIGTSNLRKVIHGLSINLDV